MNAQSSRSHAIFTLHVKQERVLQTDEVSQQDSQCVSLIGSQDGHVLYCVPFTFLNVRTCTYVSMQQWSLELVLMVVLSVVVVPIGYDWWFVRTPTVRSAPCGIMYTKIVRKLTDDPAIFQLLI